MRGNTKFHIAGRNIKISVILNALSMFVIATMCVTIGTFIMITIEPFPFEDVIYEVVSAFATVGLSVGITPSLSPVSHIVLIMLMFLGRVGILTLGFSLFMGKKHETKIGYPEGIILIG